MLRHLRNACDSSDDDASAPGPGATEPPFDDSGASDPNTPADALAQLANDPDDWVRRAVAANPNTPLDALALLANDPDPDVRGEVAENPNTPADALALLANDPDPDVRGEVAENPNTPADALAQLASDPDDWVRRKVAENPNTAADAFAQLASDPNPDVRGEVAENPNTPPDLVFVLGVSQCPELLFDRFQYLTSEALIRIGEEYFGGNTVPSMALLLALHPLTPSSIIQQLAESVDVDVRVAVASSPNTSEDILNTLTRDNHPDVRRAATENLNNR